MTNFIFSVEKAKSGRAKCKGCAELIVKDSVRMGIRAEVPEDAEMDDRARGMAESLKWYHLRSECVRKFRRTPSWWVENCPALEDVTGVETIRGACDAGGDVEAQLDAMLETLRVAPAVEEKTPASKRKASEVASTAEGSPAGSEGASSQSGDAHENPKRKQSKTTAAAGAEAEPYEALCLTSDQNETIRAHIADLMLQTNKVLQGMLKANEQKISGKKQELVERVAEGIVLGATPKCPECKKCGLRFCKETGEYSCAGGFDNGQTIRCVFKSTEVTRREWQVVE